MKKILLIASAMLLAVSCSDWGGGGEIKTVKYVDKLIFADGHSVRFTYGAERGLISSISYSNGPVLNLTYENLDTYFPVVYVSDGTVTRKLNIDPSGIKTVMENDQTIASMNYDRNGTFLSGVDNEVEFATTTYAVYNGCFTDIQSTWYKDSSKNIGEVVKSQTIRFGYNYSVSNYLASVDLMQFIAPVFSQTMGVDPAVIAALGVTSCRTYYLPNGASIMTSVYESDDEDDEVAEPQAVNSADTTETLYYFYDQDSDGYVTTVYSGQSSENRSELFSVVYATVTE